MSTEQDPFEAAIQAKLAEQSQAAPELTADTETAAAPETTPEPEPEVAPEASPETSGEIEAEPTPEAEAEPAPEFSYEGMVRLSGVETDAISKEEATELVKEADINRKYKEDILAQIETGKVSSQFGEAIKRIRSAKLGGAIYRGGQDGL